MMRMCLGRRYEYVPQWAPSASMALFAPYFLKKTLGRRYGYVPQWAPSASMALFAPYPLKKPWGAGTGTCRSGRRRPWRCSHPIL